MGLRSQAPYPAWKHLQSSNVFYLPEQLQKIFIKNDIVKTISFTSWNQDWGFPHFVGIWQEVMTSILLSEFDIVK